jgi:hypothetical protein
VEHKWWGQSPSSIGSFETCPRKFKAQYLTRETPWVETEANKYGNRMHLALENAFQYNTELPTEFKELKPTVKAIGEWPGRKFAELKLAVDEDFAPCDWRERYLGCKIDLSVFHKNTVTVLDWKSSGKIPDVRYYSPLQLDINACVLFAHHQSVEQIKAAYYYTRFDKLIPEDVDAATYKRDDVENLNGMLGDKIIRIKAAFEGDIFPPKQNGLCRGHCDVMSCEFNGRRTQ